MNQGWPLPRRLLETASWLRLDSRRRSRGGIRWRNFWRRRSAPWKCGWGGCGLRRAGSGPGSERIAQLPEHVGILFLAFGWIAANVAVAVPVCVPAERPPGVRMVIRPIRVLRVSRTVDIRVIVVGVVIVARVRAVAVIHRRGRPLRGHWGAERRQAKRFLRRATGQHRRDGDGGQGTKDVTVNHDSTLRRRVNFDPARPRTIGRVGMFKNPGPPTGSFVPSPGRARGQDDRVPRHCDARLRDAVGRVAVTRYTTPA